jgi:hypothetical protein
LGDAGFIGDEEMSREGAMGFSGMTKWKLEVIELFWDIVTGLDGPGSLESIGALG